MKIASKPKTTTNGAHGAEQNHAAASAVVAETQTVVETTGTSNQVLSSQPAIELSNWEIVASVASLGLWLCLLTAGMTVSTATYVEAIRGNGLLSFWHLLGSAFIIITCHTVPNTAMLCCVAAFLGVIGSRAIGGATKSEEPVRDRRSSYVAAVTRGFFVFLIIQSGSILLSDQSFTNLTLEKYVRLAGLSSLFSFAVGFNPSLFRFLFDRVERNIATETTQTTASNKPQTP